MKKGNKKLTIYDSAKIKFAVMQLNTLINLAPRSAMGL
jgi:hypothetical protein